MLSKFFIDRPIFATVLSVIITLTGAVALFSLPIAQYPRISPPSISVSIAYPGASAQVVADTVAAPIEQQVTGVPGMLYMASQMGNDGSYSLSVTFDVGVDLNTALVMVQNRVALAMPLLPTPVQNQGITIRKKTPDILCMVNFISRKDADGHPIFSDVFLSNYALINVRDELLRVDGVSDVNIIGQRDYSIRIWLDPQELAARNMTAGDVAAAVRQQNLQAAAGQLGQPPMGSGGFFQLPIDTLGRLHTPEQFGDIIVKLGAKPPARTDAAGATTGGNPSAARSFSGGANTGGGATTGANTTAGGAATGNATTSSLTGLTSRPANSPLGAGAMMDSPLTRLNPFVKPPVRVHATNTAPVAPSVGIVRLRDVAKIEMGALNYNLSCTFDGGPSVGVSVYQLPGTNALDVADRVRAKMAELQQRFPEGIEYTIAYDITPFIRESISEVFLTLRDAVILVAIVVLLFLQDWRAMILPMIDVPVSLIGTFAVMAALGYSLNNISLFGLVLAIGIVVDDAIVVLENIERQMAKGLDTRSATIQAMNEITGPILGITLVLCAVFVPCAFISGITGRFFREFALTIATSTIISAVNAITMTPSRALLIFKKDEGHEHRREALPWWIFGMLGFVSLSLLAQHFGPALGLTHEEDELVVAAGGWRAWGIKALLFAPGLLAGLAFGWFAIRPINAALGWLFRGFNFLFDRFTDVYGWFIGKSLRLCVIVLLAYAGLVALTGWTFRVAPRGFVPQQDMGRLIVSVQLPDSASLARTQEAMAQVDSILHEVPGVAHTIGISGLSFVEQANAANFGSFFVILDPFSKRQAPHLRADAIMAKLRQEWAQRVKDARVVVLGASPVPGVSVAGGFKLIVEDRGGLGLPTLQAQSERLIGAIKDHQPGLTGVATQFRSSTPQLYLDIDRNKAAALGVDIQDLNQTISIFLGSLYVNSFNEFGRHWQVTLQADKEFRSRLENINLLQVRNDRGEMISLGTLVTVREITGPIFVKRYNLFTAAPITGSLLPGVSSSQVIAGVDRISAETLPRSMKTEWTELMYMQIREGSTTGIVFALAVLCVFLALAALYESWTLPLAVILVVPLCMLCSIAGGLVVGTSVNIFVQIGLVVLVGLACKNAILVVEFAKHLHDGGMPLYEATVEASRLRLRPILMTSFAFILGVVPLCVASGAGAEMRKSLGSAVFSGMLGVTVFGIFLTPVFFYVIQGASDGTRRFANVRLQNIGSAVVGALLGALGGWLLARLGVVPMPWAVPIGAGVGVLAVLIVLGVHYLLKNDWRK